MALPVHQAEWSLPSGVVDPFSAAAVRFMTERHWTEADLSHLPPENRYEIIDGRLLVTPPVSEDHQDWCDWARYVLHGAAPAGWRVKANIGQLTGEGYDGPLVLKRGDSAELDHPYPMTVAVPAP